MIENNQSIRELWKCIKRYIALNIDNAKLNLTEKLTLIFAATAFYFVAILLSVVIVFFVSMAMCEMLSQYLDILYVYLIMSVFYLLLLFIIYLMKKVLFLNPISKFISRLMLNPPKENNE